MLERPLRLLSVVATLLVVAGWVAFAIDESRVASDSAQAEVAGGPPTRTVDPSPRQERIREAEHGDAREALDDANDVLLSPFAGLEDVTDGTWGRRTLPALAALLVYGFGLSFLARFARGRA